MKVKIEYQDDRARDKRYVTLAVIGVGARPYFGDLGEFLVSNFSTDIEIIGNSIIDENNKGEEIFTDEFCVDKCFITKKEFKEEFSELVKEYNQSLM